MKTLNKYIIEAINIQKNNYKVNEGISECPFSNSVIKHPVYHYGSKLTHENFKDVIWFSEHPVRTWGGELHRFYINIESPLVIDCDGNGWSNKLCDYCCDEDGEPNTKPNDEWLLQFAPEEIWSYVQNNEDGWEIEWGDIPYVVKEIFGNKYKSVILKNIGEECNCCVDTTDYVIFSMDDFYMID